MTKLFHNRIFYISIALTLILLITAMAIGVSSRNEEPLITTTVEVGSVRELVSVSGLAEAKQTAELAFPVTGIVNTVHVRIGDLVKTGDALISLNIDALEGDRQDALAAISIAIADRNELLEGPTRSARDVTEINIDTQQDFLKNTIETENQKVANAYKNLLSSGLTAYSNDPDEDASPPIISGTYSCGEEGDYLIDTYTSSANSGYSFRLSGLETGTYVAAASQPTPLGNCGLRIQFDEDSKYSSTEWFINIPNMKSPQYVLNRNTYSLALTQRDSAISAAEKSLAVANADSLNQNAPARNESVTRANASIAQAEARLARINLTISDRTLSAPFAGTITEIDILPGETVTNAPVVTLLASDNFDVTARIPEIDIGKLVIGQRVEMLFDAKDKETITGKIRFISLQATEIDGVAYYKTIIELDEKPAWIRSGLNADIDIIIREETNVLRLPKRFVTIGDQAVVLTTTGSKSELTTASTTIEILMDGNDGYVAISGLNEGDIVVAP